MVSVRGVASATATTTITNLVVRATLTVLLASFATGAEDDILHTARVLVPGNGRGGEGGISSFAATRGNIGACVPPTVVEVCIVD